MPLAMDDSLVKILEQEIAALEQVLELKRGRLTMEQSRWKPKRPLEGHHMPHAESREAEPLQVFRIPKDIESTFVQAREAILLCANSVDQRSPAWRECEKALAMIKKWLKGSGPDA